MGFFHDKATGALSMVRLVAFILTLDASAVTAVVCYLAARGTDAATIVALTGTLGALVASGAVALLQRTKPASTKRAASDAEPTP